MAWPQLADGHATKDLKYRFQWNAPIADLAARPGGPVPRLADPPAHARRGGDVGGDVAGPDAQRQGEAGQVRRADHDRHHRRRGVRHDLRARPFAAREGRPLGRDRTTGCPRHARRRQDLAGRHAAGGSPSGSRSTRSRSRRTTRRRPTSPRRCTSSTTSAPTSTRRRTTARPGRRSSDGIPDGAFTRAVREDPVRRGLLYAGTETGLYVSFDDGASWQPFQRNLPAVPVTDLAVKNGDLVVATQGRSFWILDDLTPLRLWNDQRRAVGRVPLSGPAGAPRAGAASPTRRRSRPGASARTCPTASSSTTG